MKCTIPEISWHNREPVLSVDLHPVGKEDQYKLATGGNDGHVLIWQLAVENGAVKVEVVSDLTRHIKAVNAVRWSSNGQYLATADDDATIIVWQLKTDHIPLLDADESDNKETWITFKVLKGHKEDIYDLYWSPDSCKLFTGSVDNTAILWDLNRGKLDHILTDHKGFVQGVTWDPRNQFIATMSTDRICRLFDVTGKQIKARIHKGQLPVADDHPLHGKEVKFFHDDTFKSFFRRLQFSPDGSLLVAPSGSLESGEEGRKPINATLVFTLDNLTSPAAVLPQPKQSTTVVRFCPVLFELHENGPQPYIQLPYRMIMAVGTEHDIILYDTQQMAPFAWFHEIHYTRVTDLTWSADGRLLIGSSTDGFCALITFDDNELGKVYQGALIESDNEMEVLETEPDENVDVNKKESPKVAVKTAEIDAKMTDSDKVDVKIDEKPKKSSFLVNWAAKTSKQESVNQLTPKRITPVQIDSTKPSLTDDKPKKRIVPIKLSDSTSTTIENNKNDDKTTVKSDKPKRRIIPIKIDDKQLSNVKNEQLNDSKQCKSDGKLSKLEETIQQLEEKSKHELEMSKNDINDAKTDNDVKIIDEKSKDNLNVPIMSKNIGETLKSDKELSTTKKLTENDIKTSKSIKKDDDLSKPLCQKEKPVKKLNLDATIKPCSVNLIKLSDSCQTIDLTDVKSTKSKSGESKKRKQKPTIKIKLAETFVEDENAQLTAPTSNQTETISSTDETIKSAVETIVIDDDDNSKGQKDNWTISATKNDVKPSKNDSPSTGKCQNNVKLNKGKKAATGSGGTPKRGRTIKNRTPDSRNNSLLNFLKLSTEKKAEKKTDDSKAVNVVDSTNINEKEESFDDDFCLLLEETQSQPPVNETATKRKCEPENVDIVEGADTKKSKLETDENKQEFEIRSRLKKDENTTENDSKVDKVEIDNKLELKLPRRVPLITLCSPKSKKKS